MKKLSKLNKVALAILSIAFLVPVFGALPAVGAVASAQLGYSFVKGQMKRQIPGFAFEQLTIGDLTFTGEQVTELGQCVLEEGFKTPALGDFHTIETGIVTTKQIAIIGRLGLVGKSGKGCNPASDDNKIPRSEKFWTPKSVSTRIEACSKDASLLESFFIWGQQLGYKRADLTKTDFFNYIKELLVVELKEAAFRIAWFGQTDHATVDDSPAGLLATDTDVSLFNHIKGIWAQIYEIVAIDPTKRITIARNAQATYALQKFQGADTANMVVSGYLEDALENADERLAGRDDLIFVGTRTIFNQYKRELKHANQTYTTERLENGMLVLKSDGIEVYSFSLWDRIIKPYYNNGTAWYQPHRFVLTTKTNLRIGLEAEDAITGMNVFFDPKSKSNFIDSDFLMDAKIIEDYKFMAGY